MSKWNSSSKTLLEFFAGIGLVRKALDSTEWRCIYANDIDPKKREMYERNFGLDSHYHQGDIWDTQAVVDRVTEAPFLATASFPCTDMSLAGNMKGFQGTESSTFFGFIEVLKALGTRAPKIVMLENVPGFLSSHNGKDFTSAAEALADLGYWLDSFVVDAKWFVPQSRQRLFIIGYHQSILGAKSLQNSRQLRLFDDQWDSDSNHQIHIRPSKLREVMSRVKLSTGWASVVSEQPQQAIYSLVDYLDIDGKHDWWSRLDVDRHLGMLSDRHKSMLQALKRKRDQRFALTAFRRVREGELRLEVRFDGIAGCLRTPRGGSAKQIVLMLERGTIKMRWMTPREYASLQGVPEFKLPTNTIQGLFGFGDAVCVPVIEWIDQKMLSPVFEDIARNTSRKKATGRPICRKSSRRLSAAASCAR